jgi:hypothetical protein
MYVQTLFSIITSHGLNEPATEIKSAGAGKGDLSLPPPLRVSSLRVSREHQCWKHPTLLVI